MQAWSDTNAYIATLTHLAGLFQSNMQQYMNSSLVSSSLAEEIEAGGPKMPQSQQQPTPIRANSFPEPQAVSPPSCAVVAGMSSLDQVDKSNVLA